MIEKLFDIKYPDFYDWMEDNYFHIVEAYEYSYEYKGMNELSDYVEKRYLEIWKEYKELVMNQVKDFFRDLLNQEKDE
jgi:hypothetical protein